MVFIFVQHPKPLTNTCYRLQPSQKPKDEKKTKTKKRAVQKQKGANNM